MNFKYYLYAFLITNLGCFGQITLQADGETDTHQLISNAFAPDYNPIETPGFKKGNCDNHSEFNKKHITQVYDSILEKHVFKFVIHVKEDNDRCKKFDRQRNEIKGYKASPIGLKGYIGETITYKWKFKLSKDFSSSQRFTHVHQIKAYGEEPHCKPIFTFSTKKGKTNDYFLLKHSTGKTSETLTKVNLDLFKGSWVTVKETITYNDSNKGKYQLHITNSTTQKTIIDYINPNIQTWNKGAEFVRPKWGIYRSLLDSANLKDEKILFADFEIQKLDLN